MTVLNSDPISIDERGRENGLHRDNDAGVCDLQTGWAAGFVVVVHPTAGTACGGVLSGGVCSNRDGTHTNEKETEEMTC